MRFAGNRIAYLIRSASLFFRYDRLNIAYRQMDERSFVMQNVIALGLTLGGIVFATVALVALAGVPALPSLVPMDDRCLCCSR
jgi:hypothetical protein